MGLRLQVACRVKEQMDGRHWFPKENVLVRHAAHPFVCTKRGANEAGCRAHGDLHRNVDMYDSLGPKTPLAPHRALLKT